MTDPTPIHPFANTGQSKLVSSSPAMLSDQVYDVLKAVVTLVLPGLGSLYFALSGIWDFPNADKVVGTIAAINVFLGLLLRISSRSYRLSDDRFVGDIKIIDQPNGDKKFSLDVNGDPEDLVNHNEVTFKIRRR